MKIERVAGTLLMAALLAGSAGAAEAQLGRLKKAAQQAVSGNGAPAAAASTSAPNSNVIEITEAVLDGVLLIAAIDEDVSTLESGRAVLDARDDSAKKAWETCSNGIQSGSRGAMQDLIDRAQQAQQRGDLNKVMLLADSVRILQEKMAGGMQTQCGMPPAGGTFMNQYGALMAKRSAALVNSGMTAQQLFVVRERIVPFCALAQRGSPALQVPGDSRGMFYVYSPPEAGVIAPRCGALMTAINATL